MSRRHQHAIDSNITSQHAFIIGLQDLAATRVDLVGGILVM